MATRGRKRSLTAFVAVHQKEQDAVNELTRLRNEGQLKYKAFEVAYLDNQPYYIIAQGRSAAILRYADEVGIYCLQVGVNKISRDKISKAVEIITHSDMGSLSADEIAALKQKLNKLN